MLEGGTSPQKHADGHKRENSVSRIVNGREVFFNDAETGRIRAREAGRKEDKLTTWRAGTRLFRDIASEAVVLGVQEASEILNETKSDRALQAQRSEGGEVGL